MITLKVTPDGGEPYELVAGSRDVLMWEKFTKGSKSFASLMADPNLIDFYRLAHLAAFRQGLFVGTYAEFEAQCEVAGRDPDDEEDPDEEPDPTQSAASAEPSSVSPSAQASARPRGRTKANKQ